MPTVGTYRMTEPVDFEPKHLYKIQIGSGKEGYKTAYTFMRRSFALKVYHSIQVSEGQKKRLLEDGKIIARHITK
jgi:hypothetical protein